MDYDSLHGLGISNFSSSSPHRLPTVSAAQALRDLKSSPIRCVSTGLRDLDALLQNRDPLTVSDGEVFYGGVSKGKVTEIYGPPGVGKTTLGMQLTASALHAGDAVIWVDASHPIPGPHFTQILESFRPLNPASGSIPLTSQQAGSRADLAVNLTHFSTPTLPHLIALLCNQAADHIDGKTGLIIVDSFSSLITTAFPQTYKSISISKKPGAPNSFSRKFPILQYIISSLQKLAATRNLAIVIFSQCVTKMRPGEGAALVPAINATSWEQGLGCRVALFRDWGWDVEDGDLVEDVRLVEVIKAEGIAVNNGREKLVGFSINETGLQKLSLPTAPTPYVPSPNLQVQQLQRNVESPTLALPQKRKLSATDFEIPDSDAEDDEDYGWAEEDEEDIPTVPQWQGSEDILVPPPGELEADEEGVEDDSDVERVDEVSGAPKVRKEEVVDSEDELAL